MPVTLKILRFCLQIQMRSAEIKTLDLKCVYKFHGQLPYHVRAARFKLGAFIEIFLLRYFCWDVCVGVPQPLNPKAEL